MDKLIKKQQLAAKLFEFTVLQDLDNEQSERHLPAFKGQNKILVALSEEENISQKDLADRLGISVQSVAEFVAKLLKKGYITKKKSPQDGRIQLVKLTDKGRKEAEKSLFYIPPYLDYLSEDEQSQLLKIIDKLNLSIKNNLRVSGIKNIGTKLRLNNLDKKIK
ncbi:MarR family transcriptional regulator [Fructilactobacillus myrtifloralis]|uniref:MarR family transcriptional regulator n=1 Tax=Fructilactobacillus myrtifloralis TaxID=2940301 RepID=A0ABY5BLQ2_9LACO|nr:MarR family transcriptional regulator [Fructilactobacillus myrtifloralis]USS84597.1 MarR family transcriptional regulator [Fructilactobacillus myrtifloralis]